MAGAVGVSSSHSPMVNVSRGAVGHSTSGSGPEVTPPRLPGRDAPPDTFASTNPATPQGFEVAARLRDELAELKKELRQLDAAHA